MSFKQGILDVADGLQAAKIDHVICGAVALALHGFVRATRSVDVIMKPEDVSHAAAVLAGLGFEAESEPGSRIAVVEMSKGQGRNKSHVSFLELTSMFQSAWESRTLFDVDDRKVCVISRKGLIQLNRSSGRLSDAVDIDRMINPAAHDSFLVQPVEPPRMTSVAIGTRLELQSQLVAVSHFLGAFKPCDTRAV